MMIQAVLSNPSHPEYGVATIPFPIPHDQYAHCMELLGALEIGDAVKADCKVTKIDSFYTVLKRTEMLTVNVEELNYLAKRLESFDTGEAAQFQAMAHKLELFELKDIINLTFCCQQATVITDFSDLAAVGRDHYMNLHGGSASVDELNKLDGEETARRLIENGGGTITPYGVVYDNGMKLEQVYDGRFFPCYYYEPNAITVAVTSKAEPEDTEHITWLFLPMEREEIDRALLRGGITDPADVRLRLEDSQLPNEVDVLLDKLIDSELNVIGYQQGFDRHGKPDAALQKSACELATQADTVILCMGLDEIAESEGLDRSNLRLAQNQLDLLQAVAAVNPKIVVVLYSGSVVETPWLDNCQALLYAALGGQAGAGAVADALTGKVNPCGKLAETWPLTYADVPSAADFATRRKTVEYREGLYIGYRYFTTAEKAVRFPFGYGMSYTTFAYSDMAADEQGVSLTVTNTGSVAGTEIVQLYVAKKNSELFRPAKELKGFARVTLAPGEKQRITITLDDKAFRFWNVKANRWEIEGGEYELLVGASVEDIRLCGKISVHGTATVHPYEDRDLDCYYKGNVLHVSDADFEKLLGHPIPNGKTKIDRNLTLGELNHARSPLGRLVWLVLTILLDVSYKRGKPDLNILFQYNMPLRALAKMTNGAISMGMVDGIVLEAKGFWVIGLLKVIVEAVKNVILNAQLESRLRNS